MRNCSFFATQEQILEQTKTVTRRTRWLKLVPGTLLQPVVKGMGIPRGGKVVKLGCPIRVVAVSREELHCISNKEEVVREGFPEMHPLDFIRMFINLNDCHFDSVVTRIEFEYTVPIDKSGTKVEL